MSRPSRLVFAVRVLREHRAHNVRIRSSVGCAHSKEAWYGHPCADSEHRKYRSCGGESQKDDVQPLCGTTLFARCLCRTSRSRETYIQHRIKRSKAKEDRRHRGGGWTVVRADIEETLGQLSSVSGKPQGLLLHVLCAAHCVNDEPRRGDLPLASVKMNIMNAVRLRLCSLRFSPKVFGA